MIDRHAFRAEWHDYNSGIYFVTICSKDKQHIFGKIKDSIMILSDIGKIVERCILDISNHHTNVELWNHVIMPNHIHMVINVGTQPAPVGTRYIASAHVMRNYRKICMLTRTRCIASLQVNMLLCLFTQFLWGAPEAGAQDDRGGAPKDCGRERAERVGVRRWHRCPEGISRRWDIPSGEGWCGCRRYRG